MSAYDNEVEIARRWLASVPPQPCRHQAAAPNIKEMLAHRSADQ